MSHIVINSNHPPTTIRELPKSIGKRLSELSCNKEIFEKATPPYTDALKKTGFKENLVYTPKKPPIIFLTRNKESARSFGSIHLIRVT